MNTRLADAPRTEPQRLKELLAVAARLFNTKGYHATSVADIAAAMGINKGSLYHYVGSKEELLERVIIDAAAQLRAASQDPSIDTLPPLAALEQLVRVQCETLLNHPHEYGTLIFQRRNIRDAGLEEIADREKAYAGVVRKVIRRGMAAGVLRHQSETIATRMLLDVVNGALRWYQPRGNLSRAEVIDEVWRFVAAGLGASLEQGEQ